jgi:hypothetical protein
LSRPSRARALLCAAGLGLALVPATARAQQPGEAIAAATALFQQARDLVKLGRYAEACPKLAESQRLDPKLGTLLNLAVCHEKQGRTATAWAEYTSAAGIARREGQKEREDFAREQGAALEKNLSRVILQPAAPEPGLRVTLDEQTMAGPALGTPLPIDPGKHVVAASAPGKRAWSKEIDVPTQKADVPVEIPALEAVPEPPPEPPPPAPSPVPAPAPVLVAPPPFVPAPAPPVRNDAVVLMATGFGVGALGLIVGALTGVVVLSQASTIRAQCNPQNQCASGQAGSIHSADTLANVSNVSFALGVAGAGVGVIGLVLRSRDQAPRTGLSVTPIVGPGAVGLRGTF